MSLSPEAKALVDGGPLIHVDVYEHPAIRGHLPYGQWPHQSASFLVDTGSAHSFVEKSIIDALGLEPTGIMVPVRTPTGSMECMVYHVELLLRLPLPTGNIPTPTTVLRVETAGFFARPRFQGVLGRGAMHRLCLTYNGPLGTYGLKVG